MSELGSAIRKLRARHYALPYFDIELRNSFFLNFLIDTTTKVVVDYANIYLPRGGPTKRITKFRKAMRDIDLLTISLSCFLMAVSYVRAERYMRVVNDAISKVP